MNARTAAGATAAALLLSACSVPASSETRLVVFAAASLNQPFSRLGEEFESAHPGVRVAFSFDGSSTLVDQLSAGASADVLATADEASMHRAVAAGLITGSPTPFASNVLTLIVGEGNPARITGLDASLEGRKLVVCADNVPCGAATARLARLLGVTLRPVSEETRVTDVRTKVESGQADAGIVYITDARAALNPVEVIPIPRAEEARNRYLAAVPGSTGRAALGAEFVRLVASSRGRDVLAAAGFGEG